jgi:hypothetical protein
VPDHPRRALLKQRADGRGAMMSILESRSRVIERVQLESRLEKLEETMGANKRLPAEK